jgi:hypothetical protein
MEEFFLAQGDIDCLCKMLFVNRRNDPAVIYALAFAAPIDSKRFGALLHDLLGAPELHTTHCLLLNYKRQLNIEIMCTDTLMPTIEDIPQVRDDLLSVVEVAASSKYTELLKLVVQDFNLDPALLLQVSNLKPFRRELGALIDVNFDLTKIILWNEASVIIKLAMIYCEGDMKFIKRVLPYMGEMMLLQIIYVFTRGLPKEFD